MGQQYPPVLFSPGDIICNSYEVLRYLGIGGSGVVYQCRHRELNNHIVAMKVFASQAIINEVDIERFKREILVGYQVNHPNVVRCYELITTPNMVAFTMEYLGGGSLAELIQQTGPLPIKQIIDILIAICSGLEAIHQAEIVHRDLKPANILSTHEGNIKIADFGVARLERANRLSPRGMLGTVEYVSPEYIDNGHIDARSDLFSLGIMAYEMITGKVPFQGESPVQTLCLRLNTEPTPIPTLRRECPTFLIRIVSKLMEKNPVNRYQNAGEALADLLYLQDLILRRNFLTNAEERERNKQSNTKISTRNTTTRGKKESYKKHPVYQRQPGVPFAHIFAAMSLVIWVASLAAFIYSGRYSILLGKHSSGETFSSGITSRDISYPTRHWERTPPFRPMF